MSDFQFSTPTDNLVSRREALAHHEKKVFETPVQKHTVYSPEISIKNEHLIKAQFINLALTVVIPMLGSIIAIIRTWQVGVSIIDIELLFSMYILTVAGITIGFHRHFSHGAFQANRIIRIILGILGSMAGQGPLVYWVAQHRRHHGFCDRSGDPHSPHICSTGKLTGLTGLLHAHMSWLFVPEATSTTRFSRDLIQNPLIYKVSRLYYVWIVLGLIIPTVLGGILTRTWSGAVSGLLWGGFLRMHLVQQAIFSVNSICHAFGKRPFATAGQSRNNIWLVIPTLGESWHNNHHTFPNSSVVGLTWWQLDLGSWVIRALEKTGLVWNVSTPSIEMINAKKSLKLES